MGRTETVTAGVAVLVVLASVPLGAAAIADTSAAQTNGTVNVTTGQQLSTVLSLTGDDVQSEVDETGFELAVERGGDEDRAAAIAARSEALEARAETIRDDYRAATAAYENGTLSRSEYARRLATLNARATNVAEGYERLQTRSENVSALELRAAGLNRTETRDAVADLEAVRGTGPAALLQRFSGTSDGEVSIETADGLTIEVENDDGERSRELERPRDDDDAITTDQTAALDTARAALSTPPNASWSLQEGSVHEDDGYYAFEFALDATDRDGEAEVHVDGSTGTVFKLESEIEPVDAEREDAEDREDADEREDADVDDREDEDEDVDDESDDRADAEREDEELALLVANGTVAADETVHVRALADGDPAANVTVSLNGDPVGTTGADGTVAVTLPSAGEATVTAGDAELEFELREDDEDVYRDLRADATLDDGTVDLTVTYRDDGVENATAFANDRRVGTTAADGSVTFSLSEDAEELDVDLEKGEFEAEFEYAVRNGTLVQTDRADADDEFEERADDNADEEDDADEEEDADEDDADEEDDADADDADDADDDADEEDDEDEEN